MEKITVYDQRRKEIHEGDTLVLIGRATLQYNGLGKRGMEVYPVQPVVSHGKVLNIQKTSDGFAQLGPTIWVTLDSGYSFSLDGENGSDEFTWYKLPE